MISWTRFTKLFLEKYVFKQESHIELKFLETKQESMLVAEHEAKFELSKFIPHRVNTDEKKAKRLQPGLKPWIQSRVTVLKIASYATLVHKTCVVEASSELFNIEIVDKKRKPLQNHQNIKKKRWTHGVKKPFVK